MDSQYTWNFLGKLCLAVAFVLVLLAIYNIRVLHYQLMVAY